jgi:hypothetical protein
MHSFVALTQKKCSFVSLFGKILNTHSFGQILMVYVRNKSEHWPHFEYSVNMHTVNFAYLIFGFLILLMVYVRNKSEHWPHFEYSVNMHTVNFAYLIFGFLIFAWLTKIKVHFTYSAISHFFIQVRQ